MTPWCVRGEASRHWSATAICISAIEANTMVDRTSLSVPDNDQLLADAAKG